MATARTPTQTWNARQGHLYLGLASDITIDNSATLSGAFATAGHALEAGVKNITVTPPETSWEKQDFLGINSNKFQNALLDEKPTGTATLTATLVLGEDELVSDYISGISSQAAPATYTRYQIGNQRLSLSVCVTMIRSDIANEVSFVLDNAYATKWGDVRISGPDSHWEQDITLICLAKDFYWEFKN